MQVVDLADPYHPVIAGSINMQDSMINRGQHSVGGGPIDLVGHILYQAAWTCGVGIFDVSGRGSFALLANSMYNMARLDATGEPRSAFPGG